MQATRTKADIISIKKIRCHPRLKIRHPRSILPKYRGTFRTASERLLSAKICEICGKLLMNLKRKAACNGRLLLFLRMLFFNRFDRAYQ
jgi:hypothetical protein